MYSIIVTAIGTNIEEMKRKQHTTDRLLAKEKPTEEKAAPRIPATEKDNRRDIDKSAIVTINNTAKRKIENEQEINDAIE